MINLNSQSHFKMGTKAIKEQVDNYLPLLTNKQQILVLEMIKNFLNVDSDSARISQKQYNQEINETINRIENGQAVSHESVVNELKKW